MMFKELTIILGIQHLGLTPASLRAGKATSLFVAGMDISRLRFVGRWRSQATLDHYVQEAAACHCMLSLSPDQEALFAAMLEQGKAIALPPNQPWSYFFSRSRQLRAGLLHVRDRFLARAGVRSPSSGFLRAPGLALGRR